MKWDSSSCSEGVVASACTACSQAATNLFLTAIGSCVGLSLAFIGKTLTYKSCLVVTFANSYTYIGAQTRMRVVADVPVQKLLNVGADTLGTICLVYALLIFHGSCVTPLFNGYNTSTLQPKFWSGPGVCCYSICAAIGGIRGIIHWLVPLPGQTLLCCRNKQLTVTLPVDSDAKV